jgi:hypothetical protein
MQAKNIYSNDDVLVFVCTYTVIICFILVVLLWCKPMWWGNVGIHYYKKPLCKCTQCEIIHISESDLSGGSLSWRFK